jgi:ureidoacrylate peracid hydrolase
VARLGRFLDSARRVSVPVVFVQNIHDATSDTAAWVARHLDSDREQSCQIDTWGAEFYEVGPQPGDHHVVKHRYDAFTRTNLEELLRGLGRSSLLFAGVTTSICVESSLRAAVCRDFLGTLVEDCSGAYSEAAHQRAIDGVALGFGIVARSDEIRDAWTDQLRQTGRSESTGPSVSSAAGV